MPKLRRKNRNRKGNKRKGRGRRGRGGFSTTGPISTAFMRPVGIADRTWVKLVFFDDYVLTPAAISGEYIFSANSLFDPDVTGGALQPIYFDEWGNFYKVYKVHRAQFSFDFLNPLATTGMVIVVSQATASTGYASLLEAQGTAYAKRVILGLSTGMGRKHLNMHYEISRQHGHPIEQDDTVGAVFTASPATQYYTAINYASTDIATNIVLHFNVKITYFAELYDRKVVAASLTPEEPSVRRAPKQPPKGVWTRSYFEYCTHILGMDSEAFRKHMDRDECKE
jgi:hypothetical protein